MCNSILRPLQATIVCGLWCCVVVSSPGCNREKAASETLVEIPSESPGANAQVAPPLATEIDSVEVSPPVDQPDPTLDLDELHLAGIQALEAGESEAAYDVARQAMRLNDEDPKVIFLMAMVLAERQRFPEAIGMLDELAETTPDARLPALGQTADWLVRYGRWSEAESRYRQILKLVPASALVHRSIAKLLLRQGRRLEALQHLQQLCHLGDVTEQELRSMLSIAHPLIGDVEEGYLEPIGRLGMAREDVARGDWKSARTRLQADSSSDSTFAALEAALLGRCHAVLDEHDSLRAWIAEAEDSVNDTADAWYAKGSYAAAIGLQEEATRCFLETVLRDPTDRDGYTALAQALVSSGASKESVEAVRQRAALINQTQTLGTQLAVGEQRDQQSLLQLRDQLTQLQRPLEALGWRGVWLTYANASLTISEDEVQQVLDEIVQKRDSLMAEGRTGAPADFVRCNIDLGQLPSLQEVDQRLKASPP